MADNRAAIILSAEDRTRAAFASVEKRFAALKQQANDLRASYAQIATAITTALAVIGASRVIDTLDQLDDLAEKSGVAVERLSELRFAGESVGTPLEDIAVGARKLAQNMAAAAGGSNEAAAAFKAIGVEVKNADGALRSTDEVLLDIADRFAGYRDGAGKAALANEIFGKTGERLIPLLNQGRDGIGKLSDEARRLGVVYSGETAQAFAGFNDNVAKLKLVTESATTQALAPLIERLRELAEAFLSARREGSQPIIGGALLVGFEALAVLFANVKFVLEGTGREIGAITAQLAALARLDFQGFSAIGDAVKADAKRAREELDALERRILGIRETTAGGPLTGQTARDALRRLEAGVRIPREQKDAPIVSKLAAAGDPDKELRRALAARAQALADGLAAERDALSFHERYLSQVYDAQLIDVRQFYEARTAAQQQALGRQLAALQAETDALAAARAQAKTPEARTEIDNRINDLTRDRIRLEQQAAQAAVLGYGEQTRALEALQRELEDYRATLLELRGDEAGAERARAQRQVDQVRALSQRLGQGPEFGDQFAKASADALALSDARRRLSGITERARGVEETYVAEAIKAGKSQREIEDGIFARRRESIAQLSQLTTQVVALAQASGDPAALQLAQQLVDQLRLANAELDPATKRLYAVADDIGNAFAASFERVLTGASNLKDAFSALGSDIQAILTRKLVTEPIAEFVSSWAKVQLTGGGGGVGSFFGNLFSSVFGGGRASGGPVRSGGLYEVAERGPELLRMGERTMLMMGDEPGRVQPMGAGGVAGGVTVDLRGLTVHSNGYMDRMAEERAAARIARTAERHLSRRSA